MNNNNEIGITLKGWKTALLTAIMVLPLFFVFYLLYEAKLAALEQKMISSSTIISNIDTKTNQNKDEMKKENEDSKNQLLEELKQNMKRISMLSDNNKQEINSEIQNLEDLIQNLQKLAENRNKKDKIDEENDIEMRSMLNNVTNLISNRLEDFFEKLVNAQQDNNKELLSKIPQQPLQSESIFNAPFEDDNSSKKKPYNESSAYFSYDEQLDNKAYQEKLDTEQFGEEQTLHFISHSHWDREWYLPFEKMRRKLVILVDQVFEMLYGQTKDERFKHFHFDGQTIPVYDYLQIKPDRLEMFRKANTNGQMSIGPWYVQPDEFLVSPEALIRNLQLGLRLAKRIGPYPAFIGYMADNFGHISQLPQILEQFGIDNAVIARGLADRHKTEYHWIGADGTKLFLYYLDYYCNFMLNINSPWRQKTVDQLIDDKNIIQNYVENKVNRFVSNFDSKGKHLAMMDGCDHAGLDPNIVDVVDFVNKEMAPKYKAIHSTIPKLVRASMDQIKADQQKLPEVNGELREAIDILRGVLSNEIHQKQANWR